MQMWAIALAIAAALFVAVHACLELGRVIHRRRPASANASHGTGIVEGAVFALLGLLVAFTFAGASQRFESRRQLIIEEATTLSTAYDRLDLLPAPERDELRDLMRQVVDSRIRLGSLATDPKAAMAETLRSADLEARMWSTAVRACSSPESLTLRPLVLPPLNSISDLTLARIAATRTHVPYPILALMIFLILVGSVLAGYAMAGTERSHVHRFAFAAIFAIAIYFILDFELPRVGVIRVDPTDSVLQFVRDSMNER